MVVHCRFSLAAKQGVPEAQDQSDHSSSLRILTNKARAEIVQASLNCLITRQAKVQMKNTWQQCDHSILINNQQGRENDQ